MVNGKEPFENDEQIINEQVKFGRKVSKLCVDLINCCLEKEGYKRIRLFKILEHLWMNSDNVTPVETESNWELNNSQLIDANQEDCTDRMLIAPVSQINVNNSSQQHQIKVLKLNGSLSISSKSKLQLIKSKSLENIHLNVNISWFHNNRKVIKRSSSMNDVNMNQTSSSTNNLSNKLRMNSNLIQTKLIDDHNLPTTISDDLFNVLMRFEKNRLRTFKNWPHSFITPSELSKAGFYYLFNSDQVCCFDCKLVLSNWKNGDKAIAEHYANSNRCKLINGYNVGNVTIDRTPLELLRDYIDLEAFEPIQPNNEEILFEYDQISDYEDLEQSSDNFATFNLNQIFELMKSEEKRLKTFESWPEHLIDKVRPTDLAQCGFFYTLKSDKVVCAFCRTPAWDWKETDVPIKEHFKHNPDCVLLQDVECGNQPIKPVKFFDLLSEYQDIGPISYSSWEDEITSEEENEPIDTLKINLLRKVLVTHKQGDNKYLIIDRRIETFKNWPHLFLKKERLADAGFYYLGKNTNCLLFFVC